MDYFSKKYEIQLEEYDKLHKFITKDIKIKGGDPESENNESDYLKTNESDLSSPELPNKKEDKSKI